MGFSTSAGNDFQNQHVIPVALADLTAWRVAHLARSRSGRRDGCGRAFDACRTGHRLARGQWHDARLGHAQGTTLFASGEYTRTDGTKGTLYDAGFATDGTDTIFRGERGVAGWLKGENALPNAKGFGSMPSLTISASNDFTLAETLKRAA